MTPKKVTLYRFHPETGEDARSVFDMPRPEGISEKDYEDGKRYVAEARAAGWLPYWEKDMSGEWSRCFDKNLEFVTNVMGVTVEKVEVPQAIAGPI